MTTQTTRTYTEEEAALIAAWLTAASIGDMEMFRELTQPVLEDCARKANDACQTKP